MQSSARDRQLVTLARAGDRSAHGRLIERFQDDISRYLWCLGERGTSLERLLEDTFVVAYRALDQGTANASIRVWLYSIVTRLVADQDTIDFLEAERHVDRLDVAAREPSRAAIASLTGLINASWCCAYSKNSATVRLQRYWTSPRQ